MLFFGCCSHLFTNTSDSVPRTPYALRSQLHLCCPFSSSQQRFAVLRSLSQVHIRTTGFTVGYSSVIPEDSTLIARVAVCRDSISQRERPSDGFIRPHPLRLSCHTLALRDAFPWGSPFYCSIPSFRSLLCRFRLRIPTRLVRIVEPALPIYYSYPLHHKVTD